MSKYYSLREIIQTYLLARPSYLAQPQKLKLTISLNDIEGNIVLNVNKVNDELKNIIFLIKYIDYSKTVSSFLKENIIFDITKTFTTSEFETIKFFSDIMKRGKVKRKLIQGNKVANVFIDIVEDKIQNLNRFLQNKELRDIKIVETSKEFNILGQNIYFPAVQLIFKKVYVELQPSELGGHEDTKTLPVTLVAGKGASCVHQLQKTII